VGRPRVDRRQAEARCKILDAAETLFAENGFDATPTSAVAARAGVTSALIFYYFRTKRGLLQALIDERPFLPRFADLVADVGATNRRALLRTAGDRLYDLAHRSGPMVRIVVREVLQRDELRRHWEDVLEQTVAALAERIRTTEGPALDEGQADAAARLFFNAVAFQALFGPDLAKERVVREAVELVLAGA
jgi:AcrR family transcriptional regulator